MNHFISLSNLNPVQTNQYNRAIPNAFPSVIGKSAIIAKHWTKLETYFPQFQQFLVSDNGEIIGFINTIPFRFDQSMDELPDTGWDWMLSKGITGFENKIEPNFLGGLQVIVRRKFLSLGYSKQIITEAKNLKNRALLERLVIPIRPTKKHLYPKMSMETYMTLKRGNEIFDPWIRTHLKGGAEIVKICEQSMTIKGNLSFWESIFSKKITWSGEHILERALRPINIDIKKDYGEYIEPNIWIYYS